MPVDKTGIRRARDDWIQFCDPNDIFSPHPIDCARFLSTVDDVHRLDNWTLVVGIFISLNSHRLGSTGIVLNQFATIRIEYTSGWYLYIRRRPHQTFDGAPGISTKLLALEKEKA